MRALVTGANGFIGSAIVSELAKRGNTVTGMVRHLDSGKRISWEAIQADLREPSSVSAALRDRTFDVVVDAAAVIPTGNTEDEDYFDNITMSRNIMKALDERFPLLVIKLSTVDVYKILGVITEQTEVAPQNYYSLSKRISEQFVELWGTHHNVPICILRLGQIFGKGDRSRKFIPSVIRSIKETQTAIVNGDGQDLRDYLFIDDVGRIIADFCEIKAGGTFNVAAGRSYSLIDMITMLREIADRNFDIEYRSRTKPRIDYVFDISKLTSALGDIKMTPLHEALRKAYYEGT
jgi:UDP-glucose 4-epimerase